MAIKWFLTNDSNLTANSGANIQAEMTKSLDAPSGQSISVNSLTTNTVSWTTSNQDAPGRLDWPTTGYDVQMDFANLPSTEALTQVLFFRQVNQLIGTDRGNFAPAFTPSCA